MSAPDFGTDISTFPVPDTSFSTISGFRVLAEALARRLMTARGLLPFHPDYGVDLRSLLNESVTDDVLSQAKAAAVQELLQDERVQDVSGTLTFDASTSRLAFSFQVVTDAGPFSFVLALSQVRTELYLGV